jgi:cytochrome c peroxidase
MLAEYTPAKARLHDVDLDTSDTDALRDFDEMLRIATSVSIAPMTLEDAQIAAITAFLAALEDEEAHYGRLGLPDTVPSGLPLDPLPDQMAVLEEAAEPSAQD